MKLFFSTFLLLIVTANNLPAQTQVKSIGFSTNRGFYNDPFKLVLTCTTLGASIYYTSDGSEPTEKSHLYQESINIETTSIIRAIGHKPGFKNSEIATHTFLFVENILKQPYEVAGYPIKEYWAGSDAYALFDNEMDPEIVQDPAYAEDIRRGFKEIPTIALAMSKEDFWAFYDSDDDEEAITSVELIYPNDSSKNEQVRALIKGHSHNRLKRSLRLMFKAEAGPTKWRSNIFRNAPRNGDTAVDEFDNIVLRAGNNRSWARIWNDGRAAYTRDQWYRDSQIEMSGVGSRGTFVHLFVNGLYWGLYNSIERPDESFTSAYLGGAKKDWFSISHGGLFSGKATQWNYITNILVRKDMSQQSNYQKAQEYIDINRYIDYLILSWSTGLQDWPRNNWWGGNRNNPPGPFIYFGWDCEWAWDKTAGSNEGAWVHPEFRNHKTSERPIASIWHALRRNRDFMMLFADRVYKHCYNDGALTLESSQERWMHLNNFIRNAVVAESARWGDSMIDNYHPTRTRDDDWQSQVDLLYGFMDDNANRLVTALRKQNYYPKLDPPTVRQNGNEIVFSKQAANATIYYTADNSDPRLSGNNRAPGARAIQPGTGLTFNSAITIKARVKKGDEWSALHHQTYMR